MTRTGVLFLVVFASAAGAQVPGDNLVQSLIGYEHVAAPPGSPLPGRPECILEGGELIFIGNVEQAGWLEGEMRCGERRMLLLLRSFHSGRGESPTRKIIDVMELPVELRSTQSEWQLYGNGDCTLNGRTDTNIDVMLRWGGRKRVDHRTGIKQAWGFDLERGKIVPLDISRIRCERIEVD